MPDPIKDSQILLGVTGSIACYKAIDLASQLRKAGALVDVVLTQAAQRFVTPLAFQSVTGRKAYTDDDLWGDTGHVLHVGLAEGASLFVIAPATAHTIAKLAQGLADNLLTVVALAMRAPVLVAPAMDGGMYQHPATQENIATLDERGVQFVGPASGHLASGQQGVGRMVEPVELLGQIRKMLAREGPLSGLKVVVTAGATREPVDPVRVFTNLSSGKQGFALAQEALNLGAEVTLVTGHVNLPPPVGVKHVMIETTQEMLTAVKARIVEADVLLMAAAVSDFRPATRAGQKIKKASGAPAIAMTANPDILREVARLPEGEKALKVTVGFAAETQDLLASAREKLKAKNLDLIVANDISDPDAGFQVDTNRVTILSADGAVEPFALMSKGEVAEEVLQRVVTLLASKTR